MAMSKKEKEAYDLASKENTRLAGVVENLLRDNARLDATVSELSVKLRQQIKRANIIKSRSSQEHATKEGVPESTMFQEARRAWGRAHPGQIVPPDATVRQWLIDRKEPVTS